LQWVIEVNKIIDCCPGIYKSSRENQKDIKKGISICGDNLPKYSYFHNIFIPGSNQYKDILLANFAILLFKIINNNNDGGNKKSNPDSW
jgi:hypothetical protein